MPPLSLKKQRELLASKNSPSLNPCWRCIQSYSERFGTQGHRDCKFCPEERYLIDLVEASGGQYNVCEPCSKAGKECFEVGQFGAS
jgi:hypothetical protein